MAFRSSLRNQPKTFSPPLAMQESIWNSILNGDFIDAKIFAFSRRSREPGRVDTPRALFVNTRVLAASCDYFQSTFGFTDGIETDLGAGLPPGIEPLFDLGECALDDGFDDPVGDDPAKPQSKASPATPEPQQKMVKAYVVKYTPYRTLRAVIWYIYSGEISFTSDSEAPGVSPKSVYQFADEHRMGHLKTLAYEAVVASIGKLSPLELVEEACSVFINRYPEWNAVYVERLLVVLTSDWDAKCGFQKRLSAYFNGELPHCKEIITSTLLCFFNNSADRKTRHGNWVDPKAIPRVSHQWPGWAKEAIRTSLDTGIFDGCELSVYNGPGAAMRPVYIPVALADRESKDYFRRVFHRKSNFSIRTWQALVYYKYTGCITFLHLGSKPDAGRSLDENPLDPQFRGSPCSMKEVYKLALQLGYSEMIRITTAEMASGLTQRNVIEEMFSGFPLAEDAIWRGIKIVRSSGEDEKFYMYSRVKEILEKAADGSKPENIGASLACFDRLTRQAALSLRDN